MTSSLDNIRIITVSGRIASGSTTLARHLAQKLGWKHIEGGDIFWERVRSKLDLEPKDTNRRPDKEDEIFDSELKNILKTEKNIVLETKLAGFNAQEIPGIFKVLVICEDEKGKDHIDIRIDRFINREAASIEKAKEELIQREKNDIEKWRRLYVNDDPNWVYWDPKYYDLLVNTYSLNTKDSLGLVLQKIGYKNS